MEPDYENTINRLSNEIGGSKLYNTTSTSVTGNSFMQSLSPNYIYLAVPIIVGIVLIVWSPSVIYIDIPTQDPDQLNRKRSNTRLIMCIVAISAAIIGGLYMYNVKRKSV